MPGYHPHVVVEHPIGGLGRDRVAARIDQVFDEIVRQLTSPPPPETTADQPFHDAGERIRCADPWTDAQRIFVERG